MRTMHLWMAGLLAGGLLAACGGAADPPPPSALATLDARGGMVTLAGARVELPAGALAAPTAVSITQTARGAPPLPAGVTRLGDTFELQPHDTHFARPVTLRLPFDASLLPAGAVPVMLKTDPGQSGWLPVEGAWVDGPTLVGEVSEFSSAVVGFALAPAITLPPASRSVNEGADAVFTVGVVGTPVLAYQWLRDGADLPGATGRTLTLPRVQAADDGARLSVRVGNALGTVLSAVAVLHVAVPASAPVIVTPPAAVQVAPGQDAHFSVAADGTPPLAYQWRVNGTAAGNGNAAAFTVPAVGLAQSGAIVDVVVSNAAGSVVSAGALLSVVVAPPGPVASAPAQRMAANQSAFVVLANGELRGWGQAGSWLGDPSARVDRTAPGPVPGLSNVVGVSAGPLHTLAVTGGGAVYGWGYNGFGQLGDGAGGPGVSVDRPQRIATLGNVLAVAAGREHSVFLKRDGTVWTAGANGFGQLGNGTRVDSALAVQVAITDVVAISSLADHTLALRRDGTVWAWGANRNCQLGTGGGLCLDQRTPVPVAGVANAIAVAAGGEHSLALVAAQPGDRFGSVWGWGLNDRGQIGLAHNELVRSAVETQHSPAAALAAGPRHTLVLHFDGTVFAFGDNERGQLGDPGFAGLYSEVPRWLATLSGATAVFAGGTGTDQNMVLLGDGSVWAWGGNANGQLGLGNLGAAPVRTPTRIPGLNL